MKETLLAALWFALSLVALALLLVAFTVPQVAP